MRHIIRAYCTVSSMKKYRKKRKLGYSANSVGLIRNQFIAEYIKKIYLSIFTTKKNCKF